ncbi:MAG: metal ABC transporter permease, partial [Candidatus Regiella insecticola]|nr:metal ABC transporter permease [Candidatus Regiella insecticola]
AYLSFYFNGATGSIIVTLQTTVFLLAFFFAPKHGLLSTRYRTLASK